MNTYKFPDAGAWIHCLSDPDASRLDLYCFAHAGGAADSFFGWPHRISGPVSIFAAQLPGRRERFHEPLAQDIGAVAAILAEQIATRRHQAAVFFGHSLGGLIAFEVALRLEGKRPPVEIITAGCGAPTRKRHAEPMHLLPSREFRERLRVMGGTPPEVLEDDELMALFEPVLRADLRLAETYRINREARTSALLSAWGGVEDSLVPTEMLAAWSACTQSRCEIRLFPGGHFFPQTQSGELFEAVNSRLAWWLKAAQGIAEYAPLSAATPD